MLQPIRHFFSAARRRVPGPWRLKYVPLKMEAEEIVKLLQKLSAELTESLLLLLEDHKEEGIGNPFQSAGIHSNDHESLVSVSLRLTYDALGQMVEDTRKKFGAELRALVSAQGLARISSNKHTRTSDDGSQVVLQLTLCLLLALLPSVPDVAQLCIPRLPTDIDVEGGEQAVEVLCTALLSHQWASAVRTLALGVATDRGCEHLANLLQSQHCKLRYLVAGELSEFPDSDEGVSDGNGAYGRGHARILEAVKTNTSLVGLSLIQCRVEAELVVSMLRSNSSLQGLCLVGCGITGGQALGLCDALSHRSSPAIELKELILACNKEMGRQGAAYLGPMLALNRSLQSLDVSGCDLEDGRGCLAKGLGANSTLETLDISDNTLGTRDLELLFRSVADRNTTLKALSIGRAGPTMPAAQELARIISSNKSLELLDVSGASYSSSDWASVILPALADNRTLRSIAMRECQGVAGHKVLDAFSEMLRVNTFIEEIKLKDTPLAQDGQAQVVKEELRRNKKFRHPLSVLPKAKAKSCRLVLCGREYAGKSTLCENLFKLVHQQRPATGDEPTSKNVAEVRGQSLRDKELDRRTSGISINVLTDEAGNRISVWDFAGHREFYALHDFMFPSTNNTATQFVLAFSPIISPNERVPASGEVKTPERLEEELLYWLRFIASNTKPGSLAAKPSVTVVITNRDRLAAYSRPQDEASWLSSAEVVVSRLEAQFRNLLTLRPYPCIVNARDVEDDGLNKWVDDIQESFKSKLRDLEDEPEICSQVVKRLDDLPSPIISTEEFADMCMSLSQAGNIPYEDDGWRPVAAYLQDVGEVIYHHKLDFIITNPRWFGHGVLGHLVDPFSSQGNQARYEAGTNYRPRKNGFINKKQLSNLLEKALKSVPGMDPKMGVRPDQLIQLLLLLDLCYEAIPGDPNTGYLLPALFGDEDSKAANGTRPLTWDTDWEGLKFIHVGRRLECADRNRTMLTDGFFPRLQVVFQKHALEKWVTGNCKETISWSLDKNLFRIRVNSMEILVEYSGLSGYFVDILVKSSLPHSDTVQFVHDNFISTIRNCCASQGGCPGVTLSEAIIRPACLRAINPVLCAYRKDQAIAIDELAGWISRFPDHSHSWPEVRNEVGGLVLPAASDSAIFLLNGELASLDENCYPCRILTDTEKRGVAVIISMEKDRPGGSVDRGKLEVLANSLGLVVFVLLDYKAWDLQEELSQIADESVLAEDECFVCFVNAHGNTNEVGAHYIIDEDKVEILLDDILAPFRTCKQLHDKPKVFFVNSCRGRNKLPGADDSGPSAVGQPPYQQSSEATEYRYVEDLADSLVAFSTFGGSASGRNAVEGTTFVTALAEAFSSKRHTKDVLDIISRVSYVVVHQDNHWVDDDGNKRTVRQCPIVVSSLTKRFFLR